MEVKQVTIKGKIISTSRIEGKVLLERTDEEAGCILSLAGPFAPFQGKEVEITIKEIK